MLNKNKGELAEAMFLTEALSRGFIVSKPFGDSCEYDFIIDNGKLYKIQVKSAWTINEEKNRYGVKMGKTVGKIKYSDVDFCCVIASDSWYFIPMNEVEGVNICIYPHRESNGKYEQYKNNWQIFGR